MVSASGRKVWGLIDKVYGCGVSDRASGFQGLHAVSF